MAHNIISCIPGFGIANLDTYVGKSIEQICSFGYGKVADAENHCAHFVAHALNLQIGTLCSGLLAYNKTTATSRQSVRQNELAGLKGLRGASIRVNEIYNAIESGAKGSFDARPSTSDDCLIFATLPANIDGKRTTMGTMPRKHIGIHRAGKVWHYGNTKDRVECDSIAAFKAKFLKAYGASTLFLWGAIPSVGSACVHAG